MSAYRDPSAASRATAAASLGETLVQSSPASASPPLAQREIQTPAREEEGEGEEEEPSSSDGPPSVFPSKSSRSAAPAEAAAAASLGPVAAAARAHEAGAGLNAPSRAAEASGLESLSRCRCRRCCSKSAAPRAATGPASAALAARGFSDESSISSLSTGPVSRVATFAAAAAAPCNEASVGEDWPIHAASAIWVFFFEVFRRRCFS